MSVETSAALLCEGFTERRGYAPGENQLSGPASLHQISQLEATLSARLPDQLRRLYRRIGDAELVDFWNGLWITPPEWVVDFHGSHGVRRITGHSTLRSWYRSRWQWEHVRAEGLEGRPVYSVPTAEVRDGV